MLNRKYAVLARTAASIFARVHWESAPENLELGSSAPDACEFAPMDVFAQPGPPPVPEAVAYRNSHIDFWPESPEGPARVLDAALRLATLVRLWEVRGVLVHSAGLARGGIGVVAIGPSGAGKSTLTDLTPDFTPLSDETIGLLPGPEPSVMGTVFRSSAVRKPEPKRARLAALLLLEKSESPRFRKADPRAVSSVLFSQTYRCPSKLDGPPLLTRIANLVRTVPSYVLSFPKDARAQDLLHRLFNEELRETSP